MNNIEEIIEEAAKDHMLEQFYSDDERGDFPCCIDDIVKQCTGDFKAGVEWLKKNLGILIGEGTGEYVCGDLVELDGELKIVLIPDPSNFVVSEVSSKDMTTMCNVSEIKPIPLTPQLLENNGWRLQSGGCINEDKAPFRDQVIAVKDHYSVCLFYPEANPTKFTFRGYGEHDTVYNSIKYVHQLQHLLFGLGMDNKIKI